MSGCCPYGFILEHPISYLTNISPPAANDQQSENQPMSPKKVEDCVSLTLYNQIVNASPLSDRRIKARIKAPTETMKPISYCDLQLFWSS